MTWTKTYYGVSHLSGVKSGFQATVEDHTTYTKAFVLRGLAALAEVNKPNPEEAKLWAERQAKSLGILEGGRK